MDNTQDYKPLPSYIYEMETIVKGRGIATSKQLNKNHIVGVTHYIVREQDKNKFHQGLIRTTLGGRLNHSSNPNCSLVCGEGDDCHSYYLKVVFDTIIRGSELTIDYGRHKCGESYFCVKKVYEVFDELKYFDPLYSMIDDTEKYAEQSKLDADIGKMIGALGDTEKGELCELLRSIDKHLVIKHYEL